VLSRSRLVQAALFLVTCATMAAPPLVNHLRADRTPPWPLYGADAEPAVRMPNFGNKDYPLWYHVGRIVVEDHKFPAGFPLYPTDPGRPFPFMYPPFAAVCLGLLSLLGPTGMLVALILLNAVSLAVVVELSVRMAAGTGRVSIWLRTIPAAVCLFFVNDMFLLGQPNLGLLCLVLGGLMLTRAGRGWAGGALFAAAAAVKAFPVVVIVYLIYRRYWTAAISMVVFGVAFFVLVPGAVRGFDRTFGELKTWADGMLFRQGEDGHGQRPQQSVGWRNQSVFGVCARLVGTGAANAEEVVNDPTTPPVSISMLHLDHRTTKWVSYAVCGLLGLLFVAVMPRRADRTRDTDAAEFGLLVILMTVGTPYAFGYYFVWLLYPLTVVVHHGLGHGGTPTERNVAWDVVVGVLVLFAASAPVAGNIYPMAYGSLFWAAMVTAAGCVWAIYRVRRTPTEVQP
jgi:hypothetical protein